jgi:4-hydroxybenzoate polyprenyltransferase
LRSIPAQFGESAGKRLPIALHVAMTIMLLAAGILAQAGLVYYVGVAFAVALVFYEERLFVMAKDFFVLNDRIFVTNMAFSVAFLATTVAAYVVH